jgi:hypothetical protein
MKFLTILWNNRTKVIGYVGAALAQLGTSGLITSPKAVAWVAFAASVSTLAVGHFNDYQARRTQEPQ